MTLGAVNRVITFQNGTAVSTMIAVCATPELARERAELARAEFLRLVAAKTELGGTIGDFLMNALGAVAIDFDGGVRVEVKESNLAVAKPKIILPGSVH